MIILDYAYIVRFTFKVDDVATTPDNAPTAVLLRNGTAANASPVTAVVTAVAGETGEYTIDFTSLGTAEGWSTTDLLELRVKVNHGGVERVSLDWNTYAHPDAPMRGTDGASTLAEILAATITARLDASQPDYAPARAGDEMTLPNSTLTALFSDADVTDLVNQIVANFDGAEDLAPNQIAALTRDAILDRVLPGNHETNNTVGKILQFLDAAISSRSSHAAPDLTNLDAPISSRSSHAAPDLSNLDAPISSRSTPAQVTAAAGAVTVAGYAAGLTPLREDQTYTFSDFDESYPVTISVE